MGLLRFGTTNSIITYFKPRNSHILSHVKGIKYKNSDSKSNIIIFLPGFGHFFLHKKSGWGKRNQNIGFSFYEKVLKLQKLESRITNLRPHI